MNSIRKFLYRSPRTPVDCRMDFIHGVSVSLGTCTDLSESGLRGTFLEPVTPGSQGLLTLFVDEHGFQMQARVDSIVGKEARLQFQFTSEKERKTLLEAIKLFAARSRR